MAEQILLPERDEDEALELAAGVTMVLTSEGWEASEYVAPGDSWVLAEDGSYRSPNGSLRTWPLAGSETE